jgi:hypothetical protein
MLFLVIVLAWLLLCSWITIAVLGCDEGYRGSEWSGIVVACLFSPLAVFVVRPIVLTIKRIKKGR